MRRLWIALAAGLSLGQTPGVTPVTPPQDPSIRDPAAEALEDAYEQAAEDADGALAPPGYVIQQPLEEGAAPTVLTPTLPDGSAPVTAGQLANEEAAQVYQPIPSPLEAMEGEDAAMGGSGPVAPSGADVADTAAPETSPGPEYQTTPPGVPSGPTGTVTSGPETTQPGAAGAGNQAGAATGTTAQDATGGAGAAGTAPDTGASPAPGDTGATGTTPPTGAGDTRGATGGSGMTGAAPGTAGPGSVPTPGTGTGGAGTPGTGDATGGAGTPGTDATSTNPPGTIGTPPDAIGTPPGNPPGTIGTPPGNPPGTIGTPPGTGGSGTAGTAGGTARPAPQPTPAQKEMAQLRDRVQLLEDELKTRDAELAQGTQAVQQQLDTFGQRAAEVEQARQQRLAQIQTAGQWMLAADQALEIGELDVGNALSLADRAFADVRASAARFGQGSVVVHAERARALINRAQEAAGNRDVYGARAALQDAGLALSLAREASLQRQGTGNVLLSP
jgi:hypothetical protein